MTSPDTLSAQEALRLFYDAALKQQVREKSFGLGHHLVTHAAGEFRHLVFQGAMLRFPAAFTTFQFYEYVLDHFLKKSWLESSLDHPLVTWRRDISNAYKQASTGSGLVSIQGNGTTDAYYRLAYDLLTATNQENLKRASGPIIKVLKRLKKSAQFLAARQELGAAAMCIRNGLQVTWENERDPTSRHPEFTATDQHSSMKFSVECRTRKQGDVGPAKDGDYRMGRVADALRKRFRHTPVVFYDFNTAYAGSLDATRDKFAAAAAAVEELRAHPEYELLQPGYVVFTDFPSRHHPLEPAKPYALGLVGIKRNAQDGSAESERLLTLVRSAITTLGVPSSFE